MPLDYGDQRVCSGTLPREVRMKATVFCLLTLGVWGCASEIPYIHRVSIGVGERDVGSDFEPVEHQLAVALEYDVRREGVPLGIELGISRSSDDGDVLGGIDLDATTLEAYAGLRYTWGLTPEVFCYLSGGVSYLDAEVEALGGSVSDDDLAPYVGAGLDYGFSEGWFFGIGLRYVFDSEGDFLGLEGDADGLVALFKVGYGGWSHGPRPLRR